MDSSPVNEFFRPIRSYVLRQAKISKAQKEAYETLGPLYLREYKEGLDARGFFPRPQPLVVEVGFGMGHATAEIARENPDKNFLGIEVHTPGVGALLARIHSERLENLLIVQHDALEVLRTMIFDSSLAGVHLFFPDPWPKKKHQKRRIFQSSFLRLIHQKLQTGGYLYAVTDWEEYANVMLQHSKEVPELLNPNDGFAEPLSWRPKTSFEKKGLDKNHSIYEIFLTKL